MGGVINLLGPRYKAVAAVLVPLLGGVLFLISTGEFDVKHLAGIVAVALGAGGVTHVVPNVAKTAVATVDDTANSVVTTVGDGVENVTGGVLGVVGKLLGKKPKP